MLNKNIIIIFFAVVSFTITNGFAQVNDNYIVDYKQDTNKFNLHLENCNFVWNNEYFNPIVNGYTLIGYFFTPTVEYSFTPNIRASAGVHLLKYSGKDKFSRIVPVYSVTYQKKDFLFIMGTLKGTVNHKLSDALFLSERYFTDNIENGVQALWNKPKLFLDIWLDWRNFIFKNDANQEHLTAGISSQIHLIKNDSWQLTIPASLLLEHRGGQIDTSAANMKTAINYGVGLNTIYSLNSKWINKIGIGGQYVGFKDNSPTVGSLYKSGYGTMVDVSVYRGSSFLKFGYWNAEKYLSILGHPIYQCMSEKGSDAKNRELLVTKLYLDYNIYKGINLGFTSEAFYDLKTYDLDFTVGLTLLINYSWHK